MFIKDGWCSEGAFFCISSLCDLSRMHRPKSARCRSLRCLSYHRRSLPLVFGRIYQITPLHRSCRTARRWWASNELARRCYRTHVRHQTLSSNNLKQILRVIKKFKETLSTKKRRQTVISMFFSFKGLKRPGKSIEQIEEWSMAEGDWGATQ